MRSLLASTPAGAREGQSITIQTLSTRGMAPKQGIEYWNDVACNTFTAQSIDPLDDRFRAAMYRANLGDMRVALAESTSAVVTRSRHQVGRSPQAYFLLHLQLAGRSLNRQDGREVELTQSDLLIFDSTRPYQIEFHEATSILVLRAPQSLFHRGMPSPQAVTLVPVRGRSGAGYLASRLIQDVWAGLQKGLPVESSEHLCHAVVDLVASAYAAVPRVRRESPSKASLLRAQICNFIEKHLGEQDLSIASIATTFGITSRYVHTLFQADNNTVSEYIQSRRLQEAAKTLANPVRSMASIGEVAVTHGFKSQAHFARIFRERYGLPPRGFRRRALSL
jgi:AraC-like DNA-binding protein